MSRPAPIPRGDAMILAEVGEPARSASIRLRDGLVDTLGERLVAIWLYGGRLSGDGSPGDVDMHVVVREALTADDLVAVRKLHSGIQTDLGIDELDAWYVLLTEAASGERPRDLNWHVEVHDENWALKRAHWFAGAYVPVFGARPEDVVARPSWSEIHAELLAQVEAAATDDYRHAAGLTLRLCRVLLSLQTREVVHFKVDAAQWALGKLTPESQAHVEAAIRLYRGTRRPGDAATVQSGMHDFYEELRRLVEEPAQTD